MNLPPGTPGSRTMFHIELDLTAREIEALERFRNKVHEPAGYLTSDLFTDDLGMIESLIQRVIELARSK